MPPLVRIWEALPDAPTYATVRTILRVLLEKQHLTYRRDGRTYVYLPVAEAQRCGTIGVESPVGDIYDGSIEQAVSSMLGMKDKNLDLAELKRIEQAIKVAKEKAKTS